MTHTIKPMIGQRRRAKANALLLAALFFCWSGLSHAFALGIVVPPKDQSVSRGANVTEQVSASGLAPLAYQWHFNDTEIVGATKRTLILTNVQVAHAGNYLVVVSDSSGSVTSRVAKLGVDPTFTIITTGSVVTDIGTSVNVAWGDYDNDGFPDLLLGNQEGPIDFLYRNRGDGTFERVLNNIVGGLGYGIGAWGDYDNDGFLDLYTVTTENTAVHLYHNQGNGTLLKLTDAPVVGPILSDHYFAGGLAWGDYDNDGFVDMMVANGSGQLQKLHLR